MEEAAGKAEAAVDDATDDDGAEGVEAAEAENRAAVAAAESRAEAMAEPQREPCSRRQPTQFQ